MMENYVFRRNKEGIYYINLAKTWEKLMVAARVIAAVQIKNPRDVLVSKILEAADHNLS
jgi:small subunit ribosomal protein SAe